MRGPFSNISVQQSRAMTQAVGFPLPKRTTVVQAEDIAAQWITVNDIAPSKVLLYLHGGGYVQNTPKTHHAMAARIALRAGVRVLYVDYRLAPEHPFPAALDDAVSAYKWLLAQKITPDNIIFAGDSAGGGLVVALMLKLQAEHLALPAAAILLSPWCDLTMNGQSALEDRDPIYSRRIFLKFAHLYAAGVPLDDPGLSPLNGTFKQMPPILIQVGERELLYSDAVGLSDRLREADSQVHLSIYPGLWHVWQVYPSWIVPESQTAIDEIGGFIRSL